MEFGRGDDLSNTGNSLTTSNYLEQSFDEFSATLRRHLVGLGWKGNQSSGMVLVVKTQGFERKTFKPWCVP